MTDNDKIDIRNWTDQDVYDVAAYGRCGCGRPFRGGVEQLDDGTWRTYCRCDSGHTMGGDQCCATREDDTA